MMQTSERKKKKKTLAVKFGDGTSLDPAAQDGI